MNRDQRRIALLRESILRITTAELLEFQRALRAGTRTMRRVYRTPAPPRKPVAYVKLDSRKGIAPHLVVG